MRRPPRSAEAGPMPPHHPRRLGARFTVAISVRDLSKVKCGFTPYVASGRKIAGFDKALSARNYRAKCGSSPVPALRWPSDRQIRLHFALGKGCVAVTDLRAGAGPPPGPGIGGGTGQRPEACRKQKGSKGGAFPPAVRARILPAQCDAGAAVPVRRDASLRPRRSQPRHKAASIVAEGFPQAGRAVILLSWIVAPHFSPRSPLLCLS